MPLPASIISLISSGASSGGSATPLPTATALVTELLPPDAGWSPFSEEAAWVGAAPASVSPGSGAVSSVACAVASPATGCTALACELVGSGRRRRGGGDHRRAGLRGGRTRVVTGRAEREVTDDEQQHSDRARGDRD